MLRTRHSGAWWCGCCMCSHIPCPHFPCAAAETQQGRRSRAACVCYSLHKGTGQGVTEEGGGAETQPALCLSNCTLDSGLHASRRTPRLTAYQHPEWQPVSCLREGEGVSLSSQFATAFLSLIVFLFLAVTPTLLS